MFQLKKDEDKIKVFVTKTKKFRAIIRERREKKYEVSIGGKSWGQGKGKQYRLIILHKMKILIRELNQEYFRVMIEI